MRRPRILHERAGRPEGGGSPAGESTFVEIDADQLARVFAVPPWLRDLGVMSWLLVGTLLLLGGVVWLLALTSIIVVPVITAAIVAAVLSPVVGWLARHRMGRGGGAAIVFLSVIVLGVLLTVLLLSGVTSEIPELKKRPPQRRRQGAELAQGRGRGARASRRARATTPASRPATPSTRCSRAWARASTALASLAAFLSFTALSLFFLLKDGPMIRAWVERHMGVPHDLGHTITGRTLQSLRGYFVGVTAVAAFNAIVIGLGALVLDVPGAGRSP